eukprot:scaffold55582_cov58-Phaeocystis_antarctica.AAC.1
MGQDGACLAGGHLPAHAQRPRGRRVERAAPGRRSRADRFRRPHDQAVGGRELRAELHGPRGCRARPRAPARRRLCLRLQRWHHPRLGAGR